MQNGAFGWASSLSSSLAAQKASWSGVGVGYQATLTDLFLKKNSFSLGSGINQLAAASSYLEKMSTPSNGDNQGSHPNTGPSPNPSTTPSSHPSSNPHHGTPTTSSSNVSHPHSGHPQLQPSPLHKCSHMDKNKSSSCDICHIYGLPPKSLYDHEHNPFSHGHVPNGDHKSQLHESSSTPPGHHNVSHHLLQPPVSSNQAVSVTNSLQQTLSHGLNPPIHQSQGAHGSTSSNSGPGGASSATSGSSSGNRRNSGSSRSKQTTGKTFMCPVCHRPFTQKGNLKTHMMIHSGDKPYACQICGKSFTQKGNVDTHMKIHTGEKDYSCHSCGKGFTQRGNLKTHIRSVHTKEKPFVCDMCGKIFSQKGNMMTHLRTHNKDDRFPCTLCGKTFSQKGNLKTHMQRHSGTLPARRYGPRARANAAANAAAAANSANSGNLNVGNQTLHRGGRGGNFNESGRSDGGTRTGSHLKSTDEESVSSVEHSIDNAHHGSVGTSHNLISPSEDALKHATQSISGNTRSDLHQHSIVTSIHDSRVQGPSASLMVNQFNPRFYNPSSTISAPLAHTASWLAAAGAQAQIIGSTKGRVPPHYDSFTYGFQHPGQHLTRLTLLGPSPHHGLDVDVSKGVTSNQNLSHVEYSAGQQGQHNTDFSQLLD